MNIKIAFLSLSLLFALAFKTFAQTPNFHWAKKFGDAASERGKGITTDSQGNILTIGALNGTSDFNPGPGIHQLTNNSTGIFISKLDSLGNFMWAKRISCYSVFGSGANGITTDNSDNIYITGYFNDMVDFDPGPATYNIPINLGSGGDVFVLKLDPDGNFMWAKSIGGSNPDDAKSIACDSQNNIVLTGVFTGICDFDPSASTYTLDGGTNGNSFVCKLNSSGNFLWAKQFTSSNSLGTSVCVDANDNVFSTGWFSYMADFDPGPSTYTLSTSVSWYGGAYISKLNSNGDFLWASAYSSTVEGCFGKGIIVDQAGNVYATGYYSGPVDFDPSTNISNLLGSPYRQTYITKLDNSGNFSWARSLNTSLNHNEPNSICVNSTGDVLVTGYFNGITDFDPSASTFTLNPVTGSSSFVIKLNALGNFSFAFKVADDCMSNSIHHDSFNHIYTTGHFSSTQDFDPSNSISMLTLGGSIDCFIQKMGPLCNTPPSPINITNPSNTLICAGNSTTLTVNSSVLVNWFDTDTSAYILSTGNSYVTPTLAVGNYTYYAEANSCITNATRTAVYISVSACTAINELNSDEDIKIAPNPSNANNGFDVSFELLPSPIKFVIYNSQGVRVASYTINDKYLHVDLKGFASGIYFTEVITSGKSFHSKKIILTD